MAYVYAERKMRNSFGRIVGGPGWSVGLYTDQALTAAAALKVDAAGTIVRPNPGYANSGWQFLTTLAAAPGATTLQLADTTGIAVGDVFQIVDGVFAQFCTVKTVDSAVQITLVAALTGAHTYAIGSTAGDPDNLGDWSSWISDATNVWVTVTKVGSNSPAIPKQWNVQAAPTPATPFSRIAYFSRWGL